MKNGKLSPLLAKIINNSICYDRKSAVNQFSGAENDKRAKNYFHYKVKQREQKDDKDAKRDV